VPSDEALGLLVHGPARRKGDRLCSLSLTEIKIELLRLRHSCLRQAAGCPSRGDRQTIAGRPRNKGYAPMGHKGEVPECGYPDAIGERRTWGEPLNLRK
jgi:hypothetical protein